MDDLRLHAVVARVVAWHNRHPLARRISAAQVNSVGYVSVPYTAPGLPPSLAPAPPAPPPAPVPGPVPGEPIDIDPVIETEDPGAIVIDVDPELQSSADADVDVATATATATAAPPPPAAAAHTAPAVSSLRARASAGEGAADSPSGAATGPVPQAALPPPGAPRTLVCSEDFLAPEPIRKVLDWVRRHGLALADEPVDGPVHPVPVDAALLPSGAGVARLWVATAAIEIGGRRHRLLLGGGAQPAVLGRRAWSRPRLFSALAAPCLLVAAALWLMWPAGPAAVVPAASVAGAAEPVASAPLVAETAASAASASQAPASLVAADLGPMASSDHPPRLPVLLNDDVKAQARATVAALRAGRQASAPASTPAGAAAAALPPPMVAVPGAPSARPAAPPAVVYGLSTRLLRTRAEAEQLQSAFLALLGGTPGSTLRVDMLPAGEDWRVVCWPYERRADAERARSLLQARGLRVELVDF